MTHPVDNKLYLHDSGGSRLSDRGGGEGCHPVPEISGGPRGGDSHMKQTGMLVGNFEFNP